MRRIHAKYHKNKEILRIICLDVILEQADRAVPIERLTVTRNAPIVIGEHCIHENLYLGPRDVLGSDPTVIPLEDCSVNILIRTS